MAKAKEVDGLGRKIDIFVAKAQDLAMLHHRRTCKGSTIANIAEHLTSDIDTLKKRMQVTKKYQKYPTVLKSDLSDLCYKMPGVVKVTFKLINKNDGEITY